MVSLNLLLVATVWTYWNHEPADHLRRMSSCASTVFTVGEWLPCWYDRLHGDELIGKVSGVGVDMVYCHFFKGFGLEHERAEMARTRDFARKAHAHGVKVLGYCQLASLYWEAMLDEVPDLEKWTARNYDGSVSTYGNHYYRWEPCFESREFIDYLKKVVRYGVEETGLDGFYFDNSYPRYCCCERCQTAFRQFLEKTVSNPRETCGLAHFRNVRLPPKLEQSEAGPEWHDPFQIWRQRFHHVQQARFLKELFDYVKETFGPDKITLHNPAYGRYNFERAGLDVAIQPKSCDFMMAENSRVIRAAPDGRLITQVAAYKLGRCFGFKVVESSWMTAQDAGGTGPQAIIPRDADTLKRFYAQGMIYGDIAGGPWLARTAKRGDRVMFDDPVHADTAANVFGFFRKHEARLFATTPVARAHILYATDTFYGWSYEAKGFHSFIDGTERLNAEAVPYTIVTEQDLAEVPSGDLLVLPDLRFLSKNLYGALAAAGARGVKILPLGQAGLFDENGKERAADDPIIGLSRVKGLVSDVPPAFKVSLSAGGIMAETQVNAKGEYILHLLRPGNDSTIGELTVVPCDPRASGTPELLSFEKECSLGGAKREADGQTVLTVRNFRTACSLVFRPR